MAVRGGSTRWVYLLAFVLPAALCAAWAWLRFGGGIEAQKEAERWSVDRALDAVERSFDSLSYARLRERFVHIELTEEGRAGFPFVAPPAAWQPPRRNGLAAETALALLAQEDAEGALPFFENAAGNDPAAQSPESRSPERLSPEAILGMARCLQRVGEVDRALALLDAAEDLHRDAWIGGMPFPTLAALLEHRIARARDDHEEYDDLRWQEVEERILRGRLPLPLRSVHPVLTELGVEDDRRGADLLRSAELAVSLQVLPGSTGTRPGPGGAALVLGEDGAVVVPPWFLEERVARLARSRRAFMPELRLGFDPVPEPLARRELDSIGRTVHAHAGATLASERAESLASVLALSALGAFLLCNLLLFGLARRELALSRMRSNFVDLVSHELRTPLTALTLKAEMLARGDVPEHKVAAYQEGLHHEAVKLGGLVQRVLDFARLQKARLPLEPRRVPARTVLARGLRAGRPALRAHGQRLRVQAPRMLPELWVDPEVMARALRNLLENAARYAPPGSDVEVQAERTGRRLRLVVSDRGPGLGDADPRLLFEPFRRGEDDATPGSGLGLAIVRQAVQAHGGSVAARNRPGGGAEFRLELPVAREEKAPEGKAPGRKAS